MGPALHIDFMNRVDQKEASAAGRQAARDHGVWLPSSDHEDNTLEGCESRRCLPLASTIDAGQIKEQSLGDGNQGHQPWATLRVMNVAVITPYYRETDEKLARCMASVAAQTHPATHFMVADGFPRESVAAAAGVRHIVLPQAHGDNGNTPRGIGGLSALNAGFDAFAFLDADNWLAPDHVASLVEAVGKTGAAVAFSDRRIVLPDGTPVEWPDTGDQQRKHVDTSSFFITADAAFLLPYWATMDQPTSPCCDRVMLGLVRGFNVPHVFTGKPTLFFESNYSYHYRLAGREPPATPHDIDFEAVVARQSAARSFNRTRMDLTIKVDPARLRRKPTHGLVETNPPGTPAAVPTATGQETKAESAPLPVKPSFEEWANGVFQRLLREPDRPPPRVKLLILSTPRSGSSLFCDLLESMVDVGSPLEWLNEEMIRAYGRVMNRGQVPLADYWRFVQAKATSPDGVFSVTVDVRDFVRTLQHGIDPLAEGFDGVYFVHRRDKLAQAMSLAKAKTSGQWHDSQRPSRMVTADEISNGAILQALQDIAEQEDQYRAAFAGRVRREFCSEDFSTRPELVQTVCNDLGLPVKAEGVAAVTNGIQATPADAERLQALRAYLGGG